jgi:hypothetical protein
MKVYDVIFWDYGYDEWRIAIGTHGTPSYHSYPVSWNEEFEKYLDKDAWDHILWEVELDKDAGTAKVCRLMLQIPALPPLGQRPQTYDGRPWKTMQSRVRMRSDWNTLPEWGKDPVMQGE